MKEKIEELQKRCQHVLEFCEKETDGLCQVQVAIKMQEAIWWALKGFAEKGQNNGDIPQKTN